MITEEEVKTLIKLSSIKGIGETRLKKLILQFNPISKVFDASSSELSEIIGEKLISPIRNAKRKSVEPELAVLKKLGAKLIIFKDSAYPENLKNLPDAPPFLYVRGEILPQDMLSISVIGARRASHYGRLIAEKFAYEFAMSGITVVSGLARGIDSCAHRGALKADGRTIAVLGSGIDIIYPPENKDLFEEICTHGAYISEFPPGTQPWKGNFPTRNRLISGLSKAVVVIEATSKSGVSSTVEWALEQNKEVFAVPGNITSETSKGVNRLIADGAQIATSPQDIMEYLGIKPSATKEKKLKLSEEEGKIWGLLSHESIQADVLAERLGLKVPKILGTLLNLELKGIVKQLPGRNFVRNI